MTDLGHFSEELSERLMLAYEPVGVTLYREGEALPEHLPFYDKELKSYCQALILAGRGEPLLLRKDQMGCKLGTSVLGFEEEMERYLDDGVLEKYGVGLYETEAASAATILKSTYLGKGATRAALIAPLSMFRKTPQVVVVTANSEQVMWLLYAVNYKKGGRMNLPQSGGALGGCADITALPMTEGVANITFLGLGCRVKSAIDPCDLMMGMPGEDIGMVSEHIGKMAKPIAMLQKQHTDT
jgi:uncharacterized protein (DUF169 family)